jgi:prevent-host-death family protein
MTTVSTREVRSNFSDLLNKVAYGKERVVVTRRGKGVAALIPMELFKIIMELDQLEDAAELEQVKLALQEVKEKKTVSWEEVKANLNL